VKIFCLFTTIYWIVDEVILIKCWKIVFYFSFFLSFQGNFLGLRYLKALYLTLLHLPLLDSTVLMDAGTDLGTVRLWHWKSEALISRHFYLLLCFPLNRCQNGRCNSSEEHLRNLKTSTGRGPYLDLELECYLVTQSYNIWKTVWFCYPNT